MLSDGGADVTRRNERPLRDRILVGLLRRVPGRLAAHALFLLRHEPELTDRWGWHVRPIHFYEPLPDFREIREEECARKRETRGIDLDMQAQADFVSGLGARFGGEVRDLERREVDGGFDFENEYFAGLDAALYYALLRDLKPRRVVEIGGGYSTQIADRALRRNREEGSANSLTVIEPYPEDRLTAANLDMELLPVRVERLALAWFDHLRAGDVLFIDSSHAVRFGGDVVREVLEILPRLVSGVWVHFHDIFLPHDYPAEWVVEQRVAFGEQYLLEAFLSFNPTYSVVIAANWLERELPGTVARLWRGGSAVGKKQAGAASLWIRRVR